MRRTATTANAILGLLALRREWSTWELTKQLRRNMRFFWPRAESQIYEEAKGLVGKGFARDRQSFTGKRGRTTYAISPDGRKQLKRWLATPPKPTTLECEPLLRVFLGTLGTDADLRAAVAQVRADGEAVLDVGRVVGPEYLEGTAPFQDQLAVRALVLDFLSNHARMLIDWADRSEEVLDAWSRQSDKQRTAASLASIRDNLDRYPAMSATT
ncbi:MAG TPA: PadR family transcriptional regulator [Acidimicrobiales bacterium]|jgi:DNA-binding PadR family transcriptional regulator